MVIALKTSECLLTLAGLLFLASVLLLFIPRGAFGILPLPVIRGVLLVLALQRRSRLWPGHIALMALTSVPLGFLAWLFLTPWTTMD